MPSSAEAPPPVNDLLPPLAEDLSIVWRVGWRRDDPALEADAMAFWARENLLGNEAAARARAKELNICAYVDGELAAVSTAVLRDTPFLKTRLAMHRCAVAEPYRRQNLSRWINVQSIAQLEAWSLAHPDEKVTGVGTVVQAKVDNAKTPVWRTGFMLVGYTKEGEQFRVAWFPHARLS